MYQIFDHVLQALELGMNFLADDMSAVLAVKLRKRLGFGIWTKMHVTGMHVEGKVNNQTCSQSYPIIRLIIQSF